MDAVDVLDGPVNSSGHQFVHLLGLVTFHEVGGPAAASQELLQFLMLNASQHGRVADLITIEVQDRQHRSIGPGVEKLIGLP